MKAVNRFTLDFLKTEAGAGFILAAFAALAIAWANSPWAAAYFAFIQFPIPVSIGNWRFDYALGEWVKEGLMTVFFFTVGLEIKYEIFRGELSNPKTLALPVCAAIGGMVVPALIYAAVNASGVFGSGDMRGWSVPVATDIAFALAVLAMVGRGLPASLRVFLLTLAIVDDLGAVAIIGVFYHSAFAPLYLGLVAGLLAATMAVKLIPGLKHRDLGVLYGLLFIAVWAMSLKAGLSPSLGAVASAFCVPIDAGEGRAEILKKLTHLIHPYVAYIILPLFALTASGFTLSGVGMASLADPRFLGVVLGLFVGKPVGAFGAARLAVWLNIARLPEDSTAWQLYGVCLLCGIGFTMSLFLGALAFPQAAIDAQNAVKSGVILASILSACAGAIILSRAKMTRPLHE